MTFQRLNLAAIDGAPRIKNALLELNNRNAEALSWLDEARFLHLVDQAFCCLYVPDAEALLISFDQQADYDSPNFRWFKDRFDRFAYVDRIVIAETARGCGYARMLYEELFRQAQASGYSRITCEVNADPPNPASDAFHAKMGFAEIGMAQLENGKIVRYFEKLLS